MPVYKGGRGVKAPYQTTHVRIPVDIKPHVETLSQTFREGKPLPMVSKEQAIERAKEILHDKKNARVSLSNLLTAIYGEKITL